jgi:uncharacterized protein YaaN involved in tellurite resistance
MEYILEAKINNIINELANQITKETVDPSNAKALMAVAVNRFSLLMTHVGYLEAKLESLTAENQRLNQIAKY